MRKLDQLDSAPVLDDLKVPPGNRLARFFGTSEDFWINLQMRCDLYAAQQAEKAELKIIRQYVHAA